VLSDLNGSSRWTLIVHVGDAQSSSSRMKERYYDKIAGEATKDWKMLEVWSIEMYQSAKRLLKAVGGAN